MSTTAATAPPPSAALRSGTPIGRVTQLHVAHSELTKLRTLRSTRWAMFITVLLTVGIGLLACTVFASRWPNLNPDDRLRFHPLRVSLAGVNIAQLSIGVLGVLIITGEYTTGMIRSTFAAVPTRLPVLWAKVGVFAAVTFAVTLPAVLIVFFAGQAILSGGQGVPTASFSQPGVARAVIGAALFLTVMGVFGLGIGAIVRHTAGGIVTLVGIMFVIPPILGLLPSSWSDAINPYLPNNAGSVLWTITPDAHTLAPWTGFAVFCGYAAAAVAIAALLMRRRDT